MSRGSGKTIELGVVIRQFHLPFRFSFFATSAVSAVQLLIYRMSFPFLVHMHEERYARADRRQNSIAANYDFSIFVRCRA